MSLKTLMVASKAKSPVLRALMATVLLSKSASLTYLPAVVHSVRVIPRGEKTES
jgi:hypothetical protein